MKVDIYNTDKKYNIIYADPPWHYRTWRDGQGTAEKHYPTMKIEEIIAMKDTIQKISDKEYKLEVILASSTRSLNVFADITYVSKETLAFLCLPLFLLKSEMRLLSSRVSKSVIR